MVIRRNFRGTLCKETVDDLLADALRKDSSVVRESIASRHIMTVAMYRHENMLFLYTEMIGDSNEEVLNVEEVFPNVTKLLIPWPQRSGMNPWVKMYTIYYHSVPGSETEWETDGMRNEIKKQRRGRIAYLKEDKMFSYVYYHKAIVDEGLLEGDMYQFIALHEDILFSYFEEPKTMTHIRKNVNEESSVIDEWLKVDPESHFDHDLSGEANFLMLPEVFSMGIADI